MKWLIVGAGWISADFIKALRNNKEEVFGIYSRTKSKAETFAEQNNIKMIFNSLDEGFKHVDAVYVATPNIFHFDIAKKALEANKHVMIEKPMTHSYKLTKELYELGNEKGLRVMEAYAHITNLDKNPFHGELKTNYLSVSSKIKNDTYQTASTFNKDLFGGAAADIGVYPISLSIMKLGNVKEVHLSDVKYLNGVDSDFKLKLVLERGTSEFSVSKVRNGNNQVYLNGEKILDSTNFCEVENRMDQEVAIFIKNEDLKYWENISLETARVLDIIESKFKS